jgi:Tfp pilus assembly protein PilX
MHDMITAPAINPTPRAAENNKVIRTHPARTGRGFALLLVLIVMAVATIMAYALLASSTLQDNGSATAPLASQADALAESGVELAMYYLQHPANAPSRTTATTVYPAYWTGASNITFAGMPGKVTVTVTPSGTGTTMQWIITSSATASAGKAAVSKTVTAAALVNGTYVSTQAIGSNAQVNLGTGANITGGINSPLAVVITGLARVSGLLSALSITGSYSGSSAAAPISNPVPDWNSVQSYLTYTYNNKSGTATPVNASGANSAGTGNSAGVFKYMSGTVTLKSPCTISGTLYVPNGGVNFQGNVTVGPPAPGFPAIVCNGNITSTAVGSTLTVKGTVYAANGIGSADLLSTINIQGALLMAASAISNLFGGSLIVTYNSTYASVPNLSASEAYLTPQSVKLVSYSP